MEGVAGVGEFEGDVEFGEEGGGGKDFDADRGGGAGRGRRRSSGN